MGKWALHRVSLLAFLGTIVLIGAAFLVPALMGVEAESSERFSAADDLTTYGYSDAHENFNPAETNITALTARHLKQKWAHKTGDGVTDQPALATVGNATIVYWGSWDGYLHATNVSNNQTVWATFIGQTSDGSCDPPLRVYQVHRR